MYARAAKRPAGPGGGSGAARLGLKAAEAVSETLAPSSSCGEGLYAVCDYLFEAEKNMRRDLDRCLERIRGKQGEKLQKTRRLACNPIPSIVK